jgi:hypothetical protein
MAATSEQRIEEIAADLAAALAKSRQELIGAVAVFEINHLKMTRPDLSHEEIDRMAGEFMMAVVQRTFEMQRAAGGSGQPRH